jgi:WD40 repeat protein
MNDKKLNKLEEKLYSDTPLIGDRLRQQAAKELSKNASPESIKILGKALTFSEDPKVQKIILETLKKIKLQDQALVDAVCEVWAENRELEIAKLIKTRAWIPSKPIELKVLIALMMDWNAILEKQGKSVILPLLNLFDDPQEEIANRAKEWALTLTDSELKQEVCRLASEEKNEKALEISNQAAYTPEDQAQSALFSFITEQWTKYQEIDPEQEFLGEIYYTSKEELRQTIDEKGIKAKRVEWVWIVLGGKEGKSLHLLEDSKWEDIIKILSTGKHLEAMFETLLIAPLVQSLAMIRKLYSKKWYPKDPEKRIFFNDLLTLAKKSPEYPPKGKLVRCFKTLTEHTQSIESIVITPDGKLLITAGGELIKLWNLQNGELISSLKGHVKPVTKLVINGDGDLLVSASRDRTLCMWRLPSGQLVQTFSSHIASAWSLDITSDSFTIASGSYQEIRLWQYPTGKLLYNLKGHIREVDYLCISHDNIILASGGGNNDKSVRLWELSSGQFLKTLEGHGDAITGLAISPDNSILASASKDATIRLWSLPKGDEIATLEGHNGAIRCLAISSNGSLLATGSDDKTVKLWKLPEGKLLTTLEGHTEAVWSLTISKEGDLLATGSKDNTVRLWKLPDGENVGILTGHTKPVRCLKMTSDGQMLVSGSDDHSLRLWNWDLIRLSNLSIPLFNEGDRSWIQEAIENPDITEDERTCLMLMNELSQNYVTKYSQSDEQISDEQ